MTKLRRCIWCLRESHDTDVEHIFPEAIGCPGHLTLAGTTVCRKCNNGLAHLDQVVADDFDFVAVMNGIKRKRGRAAEVSSRGNVYATSTAEGPNIFFNLDPVPYTAPTGHIIRPFRGRTRDVKPIIERRESGETSVSFSVSFGQNKKFARGLYKIALGAIAYLHGHEVALNPGFDWVRDYVRHGGVARRILLTSAQDKGFTVAAYPLYKNDRGELAMEIRIAMCSFLLDLSPNEAQLPTFIEQARQHLGEEMFSVIPTDDQR